MFASANSIAKNFTLPVVISSIRHDGICNASIGTFVVINEEGWFVTAKHIVEHIAKLQNSKVAYKSLLEARKAIENDTTLIQHNRKRQLEKHKIPADCISEFSIWPGWDNVTFGKLHTCPHIDLAIGQLVNFNKDLISVYPQFKDPAKPMDPGTSLCKLGFPFHTVVPTFTNGSFTLPAGSIPIPLFPIEGIYTRKVEVQPPAPFPFPLSYIETSTPGLRGQSGGPTFDIHASIWAIQSMTQHFSLGFGNASDKSKASEHLQNQYFNVGWGVHSETIIGFLKQNNVSFHLSPV